MSSSSVVLGALSAEPLSTSELYDRIGYPALVRAGLIPYEAFRAELVRLEASGQAQRELAADGSTRWRLAAPGSRPIPDAPPD